MINIDIDPLGDLEHCNSTEPSRASVASFWIGCAGLAFISHATIYIALAIAFLWLIKEPSVLNSPGAYWESERATRIVFGQSLMPCMVIAAVIPILFWRGGLGQRFVLSLTFGVTMMNLSIVPWAIVPDQNNNLRALLAIAGCWSVFPILFLLTPIKTVLLRLVASGCLLVLSVCVSVLYMVELRWKEDLLYWVSFYGAAFCYSFLRRNWGSFAILELSSTKEQIERTSSRTLLELMAVCGLVCSLLLFLLKTQLEISPLYYVQASVLGWLWVLVCLTVIRWMLDRKCKIWRVLLAGLGIWIAIVWNSFSYHYLFASRSPGWRQGTLIQFLQTSYLAVFSFCGMFSTVFLLCFLMIVGIWLRFCGWRVVNQKIVVNQST